MGQKDKILIVGQIPPPFLGQAIMTKLLLDTLQSVGVKYSFVDQTLSKNTSSFKKFEWQKILKIFRVIILIYFYRICKGHEILYYNPSGHRKIAVARDILVLFCTRWLFKKTIFHFHAYGLSLVENQLNSFFKMIFNVSFKNPDLMIKPTEFTHPDEYLLSPKKIKILPNASMKSSMALRKHKSIIEQIRMVYVGAIYEERGIVDIIELISYSRLKMGKEIEVNFIGEFMDGEFEREIKDLMHKNNLKSSINFLGTRLGYEKNKIIEDAHFLIFPSKVPSESFGLVLIEAMSLKTPPIATNLNGPKYVINDNVNGIKYESGDIAGLYEKINFYTQNNMEYEKLRSSCLIDFESKFTEQIFRKNVSRIFLD